MNPCFQIHFINSEFWDRNQLSYIFNKAVWMWIMYSPPNSEKVSNKSAIHQRYNCMDQCTFLNTCILDISMMIAVFWRSNLIYSIMIQISFVVLFSLGWEGRGVWIVEKLLGILVVIIQSLQTILDQRLIYRNQAIRTFIRSEAITNMYVMAW